MRWAGYGGGNGTAMEWDGMNWDGMKWGAPPIYFSCALLQPSRLLRFPVAVAVAIAVAVAAAAADD